jgi:outer membrane protein assembly factor BamB
MTNKDQSTQPPQPAKKRRKSKIPPLWVWAWLIVAAALIAAIGGSDVLGDRAVANMVIIGLGFLALLVLAVWFLLLSGYRWWFRLSALAGVLAGVALFGFMFRFEGLTGDLLPVFAFRFSGKFNRQLPMVLIDAAAGEKAAVDLRTTTEFDFPQFLGPRRDQSVNNVKLATDWTAGGQELVWRQPIGEGWSGFAVVGRNAVTMEQRGDDETVTCYNVDSGRLQWAHGTKARYEKMEGGTGPRSTPTIDEGMVYALGSLGDLVCLDGASGQCVWQKNLLKEFDISSDYEKDTVPWGRAASPLVVGDQLVVPIGGQKDKSLVSLAAFDKRSGKLLWKGGQSQISYSSPSVATVAGVEQILIANEDTLSGHDPQTGKVLWEHPFEGRTNRDPNVSQAVAVGPDLVFISKGYNYGSMLLRLSPGRDGGLAAAEVWKKSKVMKTKFCNVSVKDGYAYGLSEGVLECIELNTGASKWREGRYKHGQILLVGDVLVVLSEDGEVVLIEATPDRPNKVLQRFQAIEGTTWNNFALSGPYLLVRNAEEAACYKLPLK